MSQAVVRQRGTRDFGLHHAFGVSVGAHALLALLLFLLTLWAPVEEPVPLDEPVLQFTFNRRAEAERSEPPRGTVPDETPPSRAEPSVVPSRQPAAALPPQPARPLQPPSDPASTPQAALPDRIEKRAEDPNEQIAEINDERPGAEAPERADAEVATGAIDPRRRDVPDRPTPDLNVRGALQDYRRALERAKTRRASSPSNGTHQNVFVPDTSTMPIQGTPFGILEFTSRDYDWSDYYRQIYWDILKAWYRRLHATTADFEKWAHQNEEWILNHQSGISFVIHRSGNVTDIVLLTPSGCMPLDDSAIDGLSEVILVPLPADFPRESELVRARFIASGEIASMRQYFSYLKRINFF